MGDLTSTEDFPYRDFVGVMGKINFRVKCLGEIAKRNPVESIERTKVLLISGSIAGPSFTAGWIIEGINRIDYNPVRQSISSLSRGPYGWIQVANFICTGLLTLAFSIGIRRILKSRRSPILGSLLIGIIAIGLIIGGIFKGDKSIHLSYQSLLHWFSAALVFLGMPISCFVFATLFVKWGEFGWGIYAKVTGFLFTIAGLIFVLAVFIQKAGLADYVGLLQRVTITIGWIWLTLLAIHLLKTTSTRGHLSGLRIKP